MTRALEVEKTAYSVVDFLEWQRQGTLNLKPSYQRRHVWTPRVKSLLIDSILKGYPIPLVFLHREIDPATSRPIRNVVDGQQRLRTILAFIDPECIPDPDPWDRFTVLRSHNKEFAGLGFNQLPPATQDALLQTRISVNVLPADIEDVTTLEIFQRMNSTGYKLNPQEIRNAKWFGEFKESAYMLAYEQYDRWLKWEIFKEQDLRLMKEVELTSDLMGLLIRGVTAKTKASIDRLYNTYDSDYGRRESVEDSIRQLFDLLDNVYSFSATRSGVKRFRTQAWFYAVFALAAGVQPGTGLAPDSPPFTASELVAKLERAEVELRADALSDEALQKVLRGATADRASRLTRIRFLLAR